MSSKTTSQVTSTPFDELGQYKQQRPVSAGRGLPWQQTQPLCSPLPHPAPSALSHLLEHLTLEALWRRDFWFTMRGSALRKKGWDPQPFWGPPQRNQQFYFTAVAFSFFLKSYYFCAVKFSWKQLDSRAGLRLLLLGSWSAVQPLSTGAGELCSRLLTLHLACCPRDSLLPAWLVVIFQLNVLKIKLFKQQWPATMLFGSLPQLNSCSSAVGKHSRGSSLSNAGHSFPGVFSMGCYSAVTHSRNWFSSHK